MNDSFDIKQDIIEPAPLSEMSDETAELHGRIQRLAADFDNFRKRTRREKETLRVYAHRDLFLHLLPVLDNFERAFGYMKTATEIDRESMAGQKMIYQQLVQALIEFGLSRFEAAGERFDPYVHEAVEQTPDEEVEAGVVISMRRAGYRYREEVLRPALVVVSSGPVPEEDEILMEFSIDDDDDLMGEDGVAIGGDDEADDDVSLADDSADETTDVDEIIDLGSIDDDDDDEVTGAGDEGERDGDS